MKGEKKDGVCKGCRYFRDEATSIFRGQCDYLSEVGKSRLVVERNNGGYKEDSCCCYEEKKRGRKKKNDSVHEG